MLVTKKKKKIQKQNNQHPTDCKLTDAIFITAYILITFAELILFWPNLLIYTFWTQCHLLILEVTKWGGLSDVKPQNLGLLSKQLWHNKYSFWLAQKKKAISAEHSSKSLSSHMCPYEWKISWKGHSTITLSLSLSFSLSLSSHAKCVYPI